jgi:hypothetical protein
VQSSYFVFKNQPAKRAISDYVIEKERLPSRRCVYNLCSRLLSDNKELNRQLDFHREEEKKLPKAVINTETEKAPLKSHMKSKPDRVLQLKKAVPRYLFRSQTTAQNQIPTVNDVSMAGPYSDEDLPYQSDHNDDLS